MVKFSNRNEAITSVKISGGSDGVLFILNEQVVNAEAEALACNPQDTALRDKLVKAQTLRNLITILTKDLK